MYLLETRLAVLEGRIFRHVAANSHKILSNKLRLLLLRDYKTPFPLTNTCDAEELHDGQLSMPNCIMGYVVLDGTLSLKGYAYILEMRLHFPKNVLCFASSLKGEVKD